MQRLKLLLSLAFLFISLLAFSQDTLSYEQLEPITYPFNIEDGELVGEGAKFLKNLMEEAQYTMIGEYHGSQRISELTNAIIPHLNRLDYKTMVLEVGPISGQILNSMTHDAVKALRTINDEYIIRYNEEDYSIPIPFFTSVSDAEFLQTAKKHDWDIIGIDQEFLDGYHMILDQSFKNLSESSQSQHQDLYQQARDSLMTFYKWDNDDEKDLFTSIKASTILKKYFGTVSNEANNAEIQEAFMQSSHIYWLNTQYQWFENNATRIKYMKKQLSQQLHAKNFDLKKDKLLIKMGGYHMSKGFSPLGLYEVGNMLNELAEFHGNKALNIGFSSRFYMEEGQVKDIMDNTSAYRQRLKDLNQMGRQEEWVIIDLRPMVKGHYYHPVKYKYNEFVKDLVKRYDVLVIPKTEIDPVENYKK